MIRLDPLANSNNYDHYAHPGILSWRGFPSSLAFVHSMFTEHQGETRPCARPRGFGKSKPEPSLIGAKSPVREATGGVWTTAARVL